MDEMEHITQETLAKNLPTESGDMDWQIMHDVSRGPLALYLMAFSEPLRPTVSINCWPLIVHMGNFASNYAKGVHIVIPAQQALPAHLLDPKAKTRSRLHYQMAILQAGGWAPAAAGAAGSRWLSGRGPGWNIFLVKNGELLMPEPRNILLGVSLRNDA